MNHVTKLSNGCQPARKTNTIVCINSEGLCEQVAKSNDLKRKFKKWNLQISCLQHLK
jgi:hypothetical protein